MTINPEDLADVVRALDDLVTDLRLASAGVGRPLDLDALADRVAELADRVREVTR